MRLAEMNRRTRIPVERRIWGKSRLGILVGRILNPTPVSRNRRLFDRRTLGVKLSVSDTDGAVGRGERVLEPVLSASLSSSSHNGQSGEQILEILADKLMGNRGRAGSDSTVPCMADDSGAVQPRLEGFYKDEFLGLFKEQVDPTFLSGDAHSLLQGEGLSTVRDFYAKSTSCGLWKARCRRVEEEDAEPYASNRIATPNLSKAALELASQIKEELMTASTNESAIRVREAAECVQRIARFSKNLKGMCHDELKTAGEVMKACVSELVGRAMNGGETGVSAEMALMRRRIKPP
ncbi:hypothetical protein KM043_017076 [Ampulex compressa]|nr:hypothetical protein KM043_017076 [Ampulex compressa]